MALKLGLASKGLILVSIPLCFEIGLVVRLMNLEAQAEAEAQRAVEARNISDAINKLNVEFHEAYKLGTTVNQSYWLLFGYKNSAHQKAINRIKYQYGELLRLTTNMPELNRSVKKALNDVDELQSLVNMVIQQIREGAFKEDKAWNIESRARALLLGLISQDLLLAGDRERSVADQSDQRQAELRQQALHGALVALAGSVIFSLVLAVFLVKTITSRINILSENTQLLADNKPLHSPLSGTDEIAQLDHVFHNMASALEEAARGRQDLVSMLTHDLRSPLTVIQSCLEMITLNEKIKLDDRGERLVRLADRNATRMMELINDLLDIHKIKSGMMTIEASKASLSEIFDEVKLSVADWLEDHGMHLEIAVVPFFVMADRDKLVRVLFNLVSNAIKFSPKGGTISIAAKQSDEWVEVAVKDSGPGIPEDKQSAIFERFQQLDSKEHRGKGGSGLGLAICHAIVALHGGKIWVTSEPGEGSTFHFTVPAA